MLMDSWRLRSEGRCRLGGMPAVAKPTGPSLCHFSANQAWSWAESAGQRKNASLRRRATPPWTRAESAVGKRERGPLCGAWSRSGAEAVAAKPKEEPAAEAWPRETPEAAALP